MNLSTLPWTKSENGKVYKQNLNMDWLIPQKKADGMDCKWNKKGNDDVTLLFHYSHRIENRHLTPINVLALQDKNSNAFAILDTGSQQDNFISEELALN